MRRLIIPIAISLSFAACGTVQRPVSTTPSTPSVPSEPVVTNEPAATLKAVPSATTVKVGEEVKVNVELDLKSFASTAYQAELTYDPTLLEVIDANENASGTQITLGMYASEAMNSVKDGVIMFAGYSEEEGKEAIGTGTLATVRFKALAAGSATVDFNIGEGGTKTKVVLKGAVDNILASATGTSIVVTD
jgi:hypothetical protein